MIVFNLIEFNIDNFRVFKDKENFEITPLTVLTGTNSSGKSSFTKAIRLLTESYKSNGLRNLELMDPELKIGSFKTIKNSFSKNPEISFTIKLEERDIFNYSYNPQKFTVELVYIESGLKRFKVFRNSELVLERTWEIVEKRSRIKSFIKLPPEIIKEEELQKLLPEISEKELMKILQSILNYLQTDIFAHTLNIVNHELDSQLAELDQIEETYHKILGGLRNLGNTQSRDHSEFIDEIEQEVFYKEDFVFSANPTLEKFLPINILESVDESISKILLKNILNLEILDEFQLFPLGMLNNLFSRFEFMDGVRATQEIIYTKANSPSFYKILSEVNTKGKKIFIELRRWLVDEFKLIQLENGEKIEEVIQLNKISGYGYILEIKKNGKDIGLTGLGYGVAQLLPILIKVLLNPGAIFIIEEPESNLHPALQSKLADFFTNAVNNNNLFFISPPRFIIETHSEYFIRKLQYLTGKGIIRPNQTQLYYFNPPKSIEKEEDQVKKININEDGSLTDNFGKGFFDEADNIALELFLLNQSQKN